MAYTAPIPGVKTGPVSVLQAMYTMPSSAMAGLANTFEQVLTLNLRLPVARSRAYKYWSFEPTKTESRVTDGELFSSAAAPANRQRVCPVDKSSAHKEPFFPSDEMKTVSLWYAG